MGRRIVFIQSQVGREYAFASASDFWAVVERALTPSGEAQTVVMNYARDLECCADNRTWRHAQCPPPFLLLMLILLTTSHRREFMPTTGRFTCKRDASIEMHICLL